MYNLNLDKPIGISIYDPLIYDERGLFYRALGEKRINLPPGKYLINNKFTEIPFINYPLPNLPFPEKIYAVPKLKDMRIEFRDDIKPKAQIDIHRRLMQINENMRNVSTPEFFCVVLHELGHFMYKSEHKCDIYAIREMLKLGFNPSQMKAFLSVLIHSPKRKEIIYETAKKADREQKPNNAANRSRRRTLFSLFQKEQGAKSRSGKTVRGTALVN